MSATEEVVAPAVEAPPATEEPSKSEEKPAREKKLKDLKEKKPRQTKTKPKTAPHPPYFQMIKEALLALNEKSGSSPYAIAKYMEENHKALPVNFKKTLALQLKNSEARGKLVKVKASYKLSDAGKKDKSTGKRTTRASSKPKEEENKKTKSTRTKTKTKAAAAPKKKQVKKNKKSSAAKPKQPKSIKSPAAKKAKKAAA
ncbi:hypothetical protein ACLB2K_001011 [Fragaria x ananassa]